MPSLHLDENTTIQAVEDLVPEWMHLWASCPFASPFQTPDWLLPWWQHLGGGQLCVLALRRDGELVGLAPLFLHEWKGRRQLSPIGVSYSDYVDFLLLPECADVSLDLIWEHLKNIQARWDIMDLPDLPEDSALLSASLPIGLDASKDDATPCPVLVLPATVDAFISGLSGHHQRNLRRAQRILNESGPVHIELASAETVSEFINALFELHARRWQAAGEQGVLSDSHVQAFHREAAARLQQRELLRLYGLQQNNKLIAVLYTLVGQRRVYAYLDGFAPELERASPGALLTFHAIQQAIREGQYEYDFLRGQEEHKYIWGALDRQNYRMLVWHSPVPNGFMRRTYAQGS